VTAHWEHFAHQADIGVRGCGTTKDEAFAQAALALTAVITDPAQVAAQTRIAVHCQAPDDELLFVDWLNAIIYEMATRQMLFGRAEVKTSLGTLHGWLWGEAVDRIKHRPTVEIKGATYTAVKVGRDEHGHWIAQCVVDV
jgi:tRNA nucleotidyltransferase (CCA-adding enzyme)